MAVFTVKDEEVTLESLVEEPGQTSINHLDVQVVRGQFASVDEFDNRGESPLVHILDVDLSLLGLLHVSENHVSKHRRPEPEIIKYIINYVSTQKGGNKSI